GGAHNAKRQADCNREKSPQPRVSLSPWERAGGRAAMLEVSIPPVTRAGSRPPMPGSHNDRNKRQPALVFRCTRLLCVLGLPNSRTLDADVRIAAQDTVCTRQ